ncbi:MAG TPA: TonB family protein [Gemmatimonadales bacterium]
MSTSLVTHALVVSLAVVATQNALDAPMPAPDRVILLAIPKPASEPPPPEVERETVRATVIGEAPPKGFQTIATLQDIPTVIPPVDPTQRPLDPRDFTGRGVEGGVADGVLGGTGKVDVSGGALEAVYEATTSDARFEQATVVSEPAPAYPRALQAAGIEGQVALEFVVDTSGRVESSSIRTLQSSHEAFETAARAAVAAAIFRPARFGGHLVRQLTRQSIRFVTKPN